MEVEYFAPTVRECRSLLGRFLVSCAILTSAGLAVAGGQPAAFSPDIHVALSPGTFADHDAGVGSLTGGSALDLGNLPDAADVDALHGLPNGDILFSLDVSTQLAGSLYTPSDIVRWNGNTWSREFDGRGNGIPDGVNVDAVAMSGATLLLSIDVAAVLSGIYFSDADVIAFSGGAFSQFQQASGVGIADEADVDALHVDDEPGVLVSFDVSGNMSGLLFSDEDVLRRANSSWSLSVDGSAANAAWVAADLDAWSSALPGGFIFKDSFE